MTGWTFITNHGAVLVIIQQEGQITAREIAARLRITERSVLRIIRDLVQEGYIHRERVGRANRYQVNTHIPLRRAEARDVAVGDLLRVLSPSD